MNRFSMRVTAAAIPMLVLAGAVAIAQDRVAAIPDTKVLLENECVRVQYHDVAVGETTAMHSHPKYVVYVLHPYKARIKLADGSPRISERKAGDAFWNEATTHSVENLGKTDIHNLVVELKPGSACR